MTHVDDNIEETPIFTDEVKGCAVEVYLPAGGTGGVHATAQLGNRCARINLDPNLINLQTITHEVHHVVNWFAATGAINGMEAEARYCGLWTECIVAALLRRGWTPAKKDARLAVFNTDVLVALARPTPTPSP